MAGKIHAYHAAATFADAQIGRVLDELHKLGLEKNIRNVLWGDHGIWTKPTNYEQAIGYYEKYKNNVHYQLIWK